MPTEELSRVADSPRSAGSAVRIGGLVAILAASLFALDLGDAPFADEYAYITQSYQPDLLYAGRWNDPAWLEPVGYDLVPLPKYLINASFRAAGIPRPTRRDAIAWYQNIERRWGSDRELLIARVPSVLAGSLGCVSVFALGTLVAGRAAGATAALLLAVNPLYRLHAHRAMSEAPCEALLLTALALGLWAWKSLVEHRSRIAPLGAMTAAGFAAGVSILAKFNGLLAIPILTTWAVLGWTLLAGDRARQVFLGAGLALSILIAAGVFVCLNPFMTARPAERLPVEMRAIAEMNIGRRFLFLVNHRREVSQQQREIFPHNALPTLSDRARVAAVQGFGRFGPFGPRKSDSTIRYDLAQDWGVLVWLPLVALGVGWSAVLGQRQRDAGLPPTGWAIACWTGIAMAVVVGYLPMAWDRYLLPIQAPAALSAALPLAGAGLALRSWFARIAVRA